MTGGLGERGAFVTGELPRSGGMHVAMGDDCVDLVKARTVQRRSQRAGARRNPGDAARPHGIRKIPAMMVAGDHTATQRQRVGNE